MIIDYDETVKSEIRAQMGRQKLTQIGLGERMGVSQQAVSRMLAPGRKLTLSEIVTVAQALQISINSLFPTGKAGVR